MKSKTVKTTASMLLTVFIMLVSAGCENQDVVQTAGEDVKTSPYSDELYIEVAANSGESYYADHMKGLEMAGEELGVKTQYTGPVTYDLNAMIEALEAAIAQKPDGIAVIGFDSSLGPIIDKAWENGIPVVTLDADVPNSKRLAFVGTGNVAAGETGGRYVAEQLNGKGKVAFMTKPGQGNLEERIEGYQNIFRDYPDIEVVQMVDTQENVTVAAEVAATLLGRYPDLSAIICVDAPGGTGAATAIKEAGKEGQVMVVAFDRNSDVVENIQGGVISASIVQQTALMPYYAVQILMNFNHSKVEITTDDVAAGLNGIPKNIDTGSVMMTKENVEYFLRD